MKKIPTVGNSGESGWSIGAYDHQQYFEHMAREWALLDLLWASFIPPQTDLRIAWTDPATGVVSITAPTPWMIAFLKKGGVIRHMRVIDHFGPRQNPVFFGSGEFLPPMTEREAVEFIRWKDIPRNVNHVMIIEAGKIPGDRSRRNEWRLGESGIEVPA
jgi:hypothetical protein